MILVLMLTAVIFLMSPGQTLADVSGSCTPTYPALFTVGSTDINTRITVMPAETGAEVGCPLILSLIQHAPSCGAVQTVCTVADVGVLAVVNADGTSTAATGIDASSLCTGFGAPLPCCVAAGVGCNGCGPGNANAPCISAGNPLSCCTGAGTGTCNEFTAGAPNADGTYSFIPRGGQIVLGAPGSNTGGCVIDFLVDALREPTIDARPTPPFPDLGLQTGRSCDAFLTTTQCLSNQVSGEGLGSGFSTLVEVPTVHTLSSTTGTVLAGTLVDDAVTITANPQVNLTCTSAGNSTSGPLACCTGAGTGTCDQTPTGSVNFFLCGPLGSPSGCPSGGTASGSATLSDGGNGTAVGTSSPSITAGPDPGFYCWRAEYPGDSNQVCTGSGTPIACCTGAGTGTCTGVYLAASEGDDTAHECFQVASCPTLSTTAVPTSPPSILPGTTGVHDTATLSGGTVNTDGTTVDFFLCSPAQVTAAGCPVGQGTLISSNTVSGGTATSGDAPTSMIMTPGKYCWRAHWEGGGVPDLCTAEDFTSAGDECFTVSCTPGCSVAKSVAPTTSKAGDSVTYTLGPICNTGTCDLTVVTCSDQQNNGLPPFNCIGLSWNTLTLTPGQCTTGTVNEPAYTIQTTDPDPLTNIVTVGCDSAGGSVTCQANASVDLVHPKYTVNKSCSPHTQTLVTGTPSTPITWEIVLNNTGDVTLNICCTDTTAGIANVCNEVAAGGSATISAGPRDVTDADCNTSITNTVSCDATLLNGLPNHVSPDAANSKLTDTCNVACPTTQACRMTGGSENQPGAINAAYIDSETKVTTGGQIGAPNAAGCCGPPTTNGRGSDCPWGEWEHNHHYGPDDSFVANGSTSGISDGSFSFHSGTASAPRAAYIENVKCDDPGWCVQARPAPDKQIFWEGTGVFDNLKLKSVTPPFPTFNNCAVQPSISGNKHDASLHYYRAHVGDFGEPAGQRQKPVSGCALFDAEATPTSTLGDWSITCEAVDGVTLMTPAPIDQKFTDNHPLCVAQDCGCATAEDPACQTNKVGCPDWYDIEIHCGLLPSDPLLAGKNDADIFDILRNQPIAYTFKHFILEGDFQIHPPVGSSCNPTCGNLICEPSVPEATPDTGECSTCSDCVGSNLCP